MEITEVRVKLMEEPGERLQAFCSITFDDAFVVRDLKIIEGMTGPFVAMPSRKLTAHCPHCGCKNHLRAAYCNQCGARLREQAATKDEDGRAKLYADIAHPINSACREMIQQRVIVAFEEEKVPLEVARLRPHLRGHRFGGRPPLGGARSAACALGWFGAADSKRREAAGAAQAPRRSASSRSAARPQARLRGRGVRVTPAAATKPAYIPGRPYGQPVTGFPFASATASPTTSTRSLPTPSATR